MEDKCCSCQGNIDKDRFTDVRGKIWHTKCFLADNKKDYTVMMNLAASVAGIDVSGLSDFHSIVAYRKPAPLEERLDIDYLNLVGG